MGCLLIIFGIFGFPPRLLMVFILVFSNWFGQAYETIVFPLLGWFFVPYTTLFYMAIMLLNDHNLSGGWIVVFLAGIFFDFVHLSEDEDEES